jgi:hypothetical protein
MAYIGKQPLVGNYQVLDAIVATTTDTYALTKDTVAVFPQTPSNCIVSLNGVIQAPVSSYTISGSDIVFASALTGSDSIDFITVLGDVLSIGTPTDGTVTTAKLVDSSVTTAKLNDGSVSLAKLTATGTKDATTFLRGDNTFDTPAGGTNTPAFMAKIGTNQSTNNTIVTKLQFSNEIYDSSSCYDHVTNYRFTPNVAGKYYVSLIAKAEGLTTNTFNDVNAYIRKNGSNLFISGIGNYATFSFRSLGVSAYGIVDMNGTTDYLEAFADVYQNPITFGQSVFQTSSVFLAYRIIE